MIFSEVKGIIYAEYDENEIKQEVDMVSQIVNNTQNTWQKDRERREIRSNTWQGKIAESIVETYIKNNLGNQIDILSYDSIRTDHFEKHAPFDFLVWEKGKADIESVVLSIKNDIRSSNNKFVRLSEHTRQLCKNQKVKIAEVKSTQITGKHKNRAGFSGDYGNRQEISRLAEQIISNDDFLCYPIYKRTETNRDYSINDYCIEVQKQSTEFIGLTGEELKYKVIARECGAQIIDLFIRVYVDMDAHTGLVLGWIEKEDMFDKTVQLKRMPKKDKSEYALYWAKGLTSLKHMCSMIQIFRVESKVYANPYTRTNFYHKNKNCRFLNNVAEKEMIEYENEESAIAAGRYIHRCLSCYSE